MTTEAYSHPNPERTHLNWRTLVAAGAVAIGILLAPSECGGGGGGDHGRNSPFFVAPELAPASTPPALHPRNNTL